MEIENCIKDVVLRLYYDEKIFNAAEIARKLGINPRTAQRHISSDPRYKEVKKERKARGEINRKKAAIRSVQEKRKAEEAKNEYIAKLFFESKSIQDLWDIYTEKILAEKLGMELKEVIRILQKNRKYISLVKYRKVCEEAAIEYMHLQDVMLMSRRSQLTNLGVLDCCNSAYDLSPDKKYYIYNDKYGQRPADLPRKINTYIHNPFFEKERIESEKFFSETEKKALG